MTLGSGPWHWQVWAGIDAASFRPTKSRLTATRAGRTLHGLGCSRPATVSAGLKTQAHTTRQDTVLHSLPFRKKEKKVVHLFPPQSSEPDRVSKKKSESDSVYLVHSHRRLGTPLRPRAGNAILEWKRGNSFLLSVVPGISATMSSCRPNTKLVYKRARSLVVI